MQEQVVKNAKLMTLIKAQTHDFAWVFDAASMLGLTVPDVTDLLWDKQHWNRSWGELEKTIRGTQIILVWKRPDGADPLADVSDLPMNIRLLRFALFGELVLGLQAIGQLSYARVGHPANWNKCKVYCDSREIKEVISADALLGVVHMYRRDPKGKIIISPDGKSFDKTRIAGAVEIKIEKETQTIF